jgi:hypothetical protein
LVEISINEKPKGQSRMDIPETLATLGTQDKDKQTKKQSTTNHRKLKR